MIPTFKNEELYAAALTHPSFKTGKKSYRIGFERLEFLGDRVLGLVIAQELIKRFPQWKEGELAKKHAQLVSKTTCRSVFLALGGDLKLKASQRELLIVTSNIYSDALEALIGALYLDQGITSTTRFIVEHFEPYISGKINLNQDYKTRLQEWVQKNYNETPSYQLILKKGTDHEPIFLVTVTIPYRSSEEAEGPTIRMAEQAAALKMLKVLDLL